MPLYQYTSVKHEHLWLSDEITALFGDDQRKNSAGYQPKDQVTYSADDEWQKLTF